MKYIRTKDGVIIKGTLNFEDTEHFILKQADTIEELCDEFVWIRKNNVLGILPSLDNRKYDIKTAKKHLDKFEIYGAIWTDKGLIYVAKMNDKGELELL